MTKNESYKKTGFLNSGRPRKRFSASQNRPIVLLLEVNDDDDDDADIPTPSNFLLFLSEIFHHQ